MCSAVQHAHHYYTATATSTCSPGMLAPPVLRLCLRQKGSPLREAPPGQDGKRQGRSPEATRRRGDRLHKHYRHGVAPRYTFFYRVPPFPWNALVATAGGIGAEPLPLTAAVASTNVAAEMQSWEGVGRRGRTCGLCSLIEGRTSAFVRTNLCAEPAV